MGINVNKYLMLFLSFHVPAALLLPMAEIQAPPEVIRGCDADHEYGIRNSKPDQLLKIANALGISINIFMDFDIETVSDVLSLLFKLDDQIDMKFEAD